MDIKKLSNNAVVLNFKKEKVKIELNSDELGYITVKFYEGDRSEEISKSGEYEYHSFYFSCQEISSSPNGKVNLVLLSTHEFSDIVFVSSVIDLESKEAKDVLDEIDALIIPVLDHSFTKSIIKRCDPTTVIVIDDFNDAKLDQEKITKLSADITFTVPEAQDTISIDEGDFKAEEVINTAYILK